MALKASDTCIGATSSRRSVSGEGFLPFWLIRPWIFAFFGLSGLGFLPFWAYQAWDFCLFGHIRPWVFAFFGISGNGFLPFWHIRPGIFALFGISGLGFLIYCCVPKQVRSGKRCNPRQASNPGPRSPWSSHLLAIAFSLPSSTIPSCAAGALEPLSGPHCTNGAPRSNAGLQ